MLLRSFSARSGPLRLSSALATPACSRSWSTLTLAHPARCALPSHANSRWFSAAQAFHAENQNDARVSPAPSGKCYIANVPYRVTAEQLKDAFSEFGNVQSVKMLTSNAGIPRGICFVSFESVEGAINFVEAHKADPIFVFDRELHVEHAQGPRNQLKSAEPCDTLMVPGFKGQSDIEVRALFGSHSDDILAVRFDKKEAELPSKKAFVQFRNVDIATEAMDAFKNQNENIQIMYARQRQSPVSPYTLVSRLSQNRDH